jgi:hypothetical protein
MQIGRIQPIRQFFKAVVGEHQFRSVGTKSRAGGRVEGAVKRFYMPTLELGKKVGHFNFLPIFSSRSQVFCLTT